MAKAPTVRSFLDETRARAAEASTIPVRDVLTEASAILNSPAVREAAQDLNALYGLVPDGDPAKGILSHVIALYNGNLARAVDERVAQMDAEAEKAESK